MFQKVSDKFHRKQQSTSTKHSSSPSSPVVPQSTSIAKSNSQPQSQTDGGITTSPMEGIESYSPPPPISKASAAGSSASSSLSSVPHQARTLSAALGVHAIPETSRTMSVEMTDAKPQLSRNSSADEERMREKAREAQEQAAAAQANLHNATQQARVAAINAAATQAALETVSTQLPAAAKPATAQPGQPLRKTAGRYALADFHIERTLGTGSFGRVHLVRSKHNSRFYAVKVLNKEKVIKMKQVEHTNSEREMLVRVRHPFLVNLWGTFQDVNNLYMVMDFVAGGELFSLLRKSQRFPNSVAKFYAAEVALALDYLHSLDIIYRDLKPENLLLGADGHVKVTDFGFAKHVPDITWTLCGTPDYLAPEVVQSKGYNKSVDWYALGVLIFEMLAGYPPFFTEDGNPMKLYEKIIAGKVRYPTYFDALAKELLKNLLVGDLTKRYGNLRAGSSDIFAHGWFAEVDWDKLYRREIPAPYVPKIEGEGDASHFPSKITALQFEWAWQKPELSRHLRVENDPDTPIFKKDAKRNWVERKIAVACTLISLPPFSRLPLHLRFFVPEAHDLFQTYHATHSLSPNVTITLDLGGVSGSTAPTSGRNGKRSQPMATQFSAMTVPSQSRSRTISALPSARSPAPTSPTSLVSQRISYAPHQPPSSLTPAHVPPVTACWNGVRSSALATPGSKGSNESASPRRRSRDGGGNSHPRLTPIRLLASRHSP
nr:uncharacterized protein CI109_001282 [Kwoniella shandongensis]KAA5530478.1 hypothetical protein CI109_001282 [Kwoniella shandongensis]